MRDYAKVSPQFWTGETGRALRGERDAQLVALYLMTCPAASMTGLFYVPLPTVAHEIGCPVPVVAKALRRLADVGFAYYDDASEMAWVPQMARHQVGDRLSANDKRSAGMAREAAKHKKCKFYADFVRVYSVRFSLGDMPESSPFEAPSKPLRSPFEAPKTWVVEADEENRCANVGNERGANSECNGYGHIGSPFEAPSKPLRSQEQEQERERATPNRNRGRKPKAPTPPPGFAASDDHRELARQKGLDCEHEFLAFLDKAAALSWAYSDWPRAFSSWLRDNGSHKYDRSWKPPAAGPPPMSAEEVDRQNRETPPRLDDVERETLELWAGFGRADAVEELKRRDATP